MRDGVRSDAPRLRVALVGLSVPGYQSLALGYVRAYAQADSRLAEVAFLTLDLDTSEDAWWVAYRLLRLDPDVVGFSVMCWNARIAYETARILKAAKPEIVVVAGGPEVGPIAEDVLSRQPALDIIVCGEGEATFADLLAALTAGRGLGAVAGLTVRDGGRVISTAGRPLIEELDSIPSPYLAGVLSPRTGATYLETYRGCPHQCAYCYEGKGYGRIRHFSRERVAAEIGLIADTEGVSSFSFVDPVFNLTDDRLRWLAEVLEPRARAGLALHTVEVDIERVDPEQAALLSRAGVFSVETGPQSVGAIALQTCHRAFDSGSFSRGVEALRAQGIAVECDLIIGLPGDTTEDVLAGLDFAIGLDPGRVQVSTLHVLPGTELWTRSDELGLAHDSEPPHEVVATRDMDYGELRRAEVFAVAAAQVYRARV